MGILSSLRKYYLNEPPPREVLPYPSEREILERLAEGRMIDSWFYQRNVTTADIKAIIAKRLLALEDGQGESLNKMPLPFLRAGDTVKAQCRVTNSGLALVVKYIDFDGRGKLWLPKPIVLAPDDEDRGPIYFTIYCNIEGSPPTISKVSVAKEVTFFTRKVQVYP